MERKSNLGYKFGKKYHLKSKKEIDQLFLKGKSFTGFPFKVIWLNNVDLSGSLQFLISVGKKYSKSAVKRNIIRRRVKESVRLNKNRLEAIINEKNLKLNIALIYISNEPLEFSFISNKVGTLFSELERKLGHSF